MFFTTHDGTSLAYEDYGQGEPVLFLASWALSSDMWEYQIPFLVERGYRCVTLDRRGHGRSERPSTGYDLDTCADDVAALIEHLDLRGVTLVGHSAGGAEAARYLARHGEDRIARVAFVSAVLPFLKRTEDNPEGRPEEGLRARAALREITVPALVVHGAADASALVDLTGRRTAALVPGAVYKEYPTGGHGLFVTHKDALNDDLLAFIKG